MKPARIAVIAVAILSGVGAFILAGRKPAPVQVTVKETAPVLPTEEILVVNKDVSMGTVISKNADFKWQVWPKEAVSATMITKSANPAAEADIDGSIVRSAFVAGEPIRKDKLIKGAGSGFLSAILPSGMRAMAINIDTSGANAAGGFILPNDRVDILRTYRDDNAGAGSGKSDGFATETVLTNVKVLAIAQTIQEENGKKTLTGNTATLELDPRQVETVTLAQRTGTLSLALRSLTDHNKVADTPASAPEENALTIIRFGVSQAVGKR
ncbi:MAG: Flp pilus assembly protein CpaB [Beijerinckiaceae bacterium]|nr:Flp pilus assembly protein CpaB [Beijerinckiaceae bacterium]